MPFSVHHYQEVQDSDDTNLGPLVKVGSAMFLLCKVPIFTLLSISLGENY